MDVDEYLQRINSVNASECSLQNLYKLQQNHLLNIPYENLDIYLGKSLDTDLARIYDKIIRKRRGGLYFELNLLFDWLLKQLGYKVVMVSCRKYLPQSNSWAHWYSHFALVVEMNEHRFLVVSVFDFFILISVRTMT